VRPLSTFGPSWRTLDDRSLDEADAAHVACERGPLDHDFEPFETIAMTSAGTYISVIWRRACPPWARK